MRMKIPIFFCVCFVLLCISCPVFAQMDDEQSVREVVVKINVALRERNLDQILQLLDLNDSFREEWKKELEGEYTQFPLKNYTIRSVKIEGQNAAVRVYWERTDAKTGKDVIEYSRNHRIFYFKKTDAGWQFAGFPTAENELISQIIRAETDDERKTLIRAEKELQTQRMLYVIIFRFRNEGNFAEVDHYLRLAEWYGEEFFKDTDEFNYVNNLVNALNARAANQKTLGNNAEAMRIYLEAVRASSDILKKAGKPIGGSLLTALNIGSLYLNQGNLDQAERFALFVLEGLKNTPRERQAVLFSALYNLLGDIYFQRGDDEKALEYYQQTGEKISFGIGAIYLREGKFAEALKVFQYFVDLTERSVTKKEKADLPLGVKAFSGIAEIYLLQGEAEKSLKAARRGVEFAEQTQNPELIFIAKNAEGKALLANNQSSEAENAFRAAIETVQTGRQKVVGGEESKISFFENRIEPYQKMVELSFNRGDSKTALEFAERAKSRVLNEILQVGRIEWQNVLNDTDNKKEQTLRSKLSELNRLQTTLKYQTEVDRTRLDNVTKELAKTRLDYEFLQTSAFANYPELRRSRGISTTIKQAEIAALIRRPNEALLEFAVSQEKIYLFAATKEKSGNLNLQIYPLDGKTKEIIDLVNNFRGRIIEKNLDYKDTARALYGVLFKKAEAQLAGKTNLTIVPDGELWNVPFTALIATNNRFLIENNVLNFAQSLTALRELQNIKPGGAKITGSLLAVGNPRLDEKNISQIRSQYRGGLDDLPDAETEVLELQKLYGKTSKILTKSDAREDVWKAEAGKYRILHLATHGLANSIKPLYSHLFLATDSNKTKEDGLLEAWEVMNLRLNADLVVLSACETGQGRTNTGEGLIGLSWVFAVANVPRVVASQWQVDSLGAAELMVEFHRQMRVSPNDPVAKSLQTAMRNQLKKTNRRHPFYWSGFISIGEN